MDKQPSRIRNTLKSTATGMLAYFIVMLLGFVGRSFFIQNLSVDLLGVNGLFSSILQIFSLAELGFATAIGVALYKPLSSGDEKHITALMNFYAKVYSFVGVVVILLGALILPFLQFFIKDFAATPIPLNDLRLYFALFVLSSSASYFFAYKKTLLISDQKKYVVNINMTIISIFSKVAQIIVVVVLKNFTIFLIVNLVSVYLENIIAAIIVNKRYPYLKVYKKEKLDRVAKKELFSNIGALSVSKLGSVFTTGIISIIITLMIGLKESGLYSNYLLVTSSLMAITSVIFEAVTASVGNFAVTENSEKQTSLFKKIFYFNAFWATLIFVGLVILLDDFIVLWLNPEMLLNKWVAIVMALNLFIWTLRQMSWVLYNAYGLYKHYFYRVFAEIAVFGVLGFIGAKYFGIVGVLGAQIIAVLSTQFWVEVFVVSKHALKTKKRIYSSQLFKYILISILTLLIAYLLCFFIPIGGLVGFILKFLIVVMTVLFVFVISTLRTEEFRYFVCLIKNIVSRKGNGKMETIIICNTCVMTNKGDKFMKVDSKGQCNYCISAQSKEKSEYFPNEEGRIKLEQIITQMKSDCKDLEFDCMMGISGGLDSSYLAYLGHEWGLRILGVHIDDGYDTETAKENVRKIAEYCKIELKLIQPDEKQYNDLLLSFMKASVPNIAIPQDNILTGALYRFAAANHIKYFLSGYNFPLECILQSGNTHPHGDKTHILAISKLFGNEKVDLLPLTSKQEIQKISKKLGIQTVYPLNYLDYNKDKAIEILKEKCDYNYYEAKHFESIFTRFLQTYWLPVKYGVDKRSSHLSSLIISGQLKREDALKILESSPIREELLESDKVFLCEKLKITAKEMEEIIALPSKQHLDYPVNWKIRLRRIASKIKHFILKK